MKIKAAIVDQKGVKFDIRDDVELADMQADDLQIHMVASGICHSDEALRKGDAEIGYPIILGHEGSGIVEKVGPEVKNFKPGDHVILSFYGCGNCINCLKGKPTKCLNYAANNLSGVRPDGSAHFTEDGHQVDDMFDQSSFTTTTVVRERNAVKVPKDLDLRKLGPLGCGYVTGSGTVFNTLKPEPGSTIAVTGTGAVGLAAMMAGKISGCTKVIAIDRVPERLELAKELGATDAINTNDQDMVKSIQNLTDGKGVDYIVDTTGVTKVMEDAIQSLALEHWHQLRLPQTILMLIPGTIFALVTGQSSVLTWVTRFHKLGMFDFDKTEKFYDFDQINQANADSVSGKTIKPVLIIDKDYQPGD